MDPLLETVQNSRPTLLSMSTETHTALSHGLTAGLAEAEMIQRCRTRQVLEATMPPWNDVSQLDKRRSMMEEMEVKEWAAREGEIQKLQEARLSLPRMLSRPRGKVQDKVTNKRLTQIHSQHLKETERKQHIINNDVTRALRKLEARRRTVEETLGLHYTDYKVYGPWAQRDRITHRNTHSKEFKSHSLDAYEGLQKLETEPSVLEPKVRKPQPEVIEDVIEPSATSVPQVKKKYMVLMVEVHEQATNEPLHCLVENENPVPHPVSTRVAGPPEDKQSNLGLIQDMETQQREEQERQKAMNLQKRRDQDDRYTTSQEEASKAEEVRAEMEKLLDAQAKELIRQQEERRIQALKELAEKDRRLQEAEESRKIQAEERRRREDDEILRLQAEQVHQESVDLYSDNIIQETLEQTAGQQGREEIQERAEEVYVSGFVEEANMTPLQIEEMVAELVYGYLFPEVRRMLAHEEAERRGQEQLQAAQSEIQEVTENLGALPLGVSQSTCPSDRASNQTLVEVEQVHQESVDLYSDDIIQETLEQTADHQGRKEIQERTEEVYVSGFAEEANMTPRQIEEMVAELVYGYLFPEVRRMLAHEEAERRDQEQLQAAQSEIQEVTENLGALPLGVSQSTCPSDRASNQTLGEVGMTSRQIPIF